MSNRGSGHRFRLMIGAKIDLNGPARKDHPTPGATATDARSSLIAKDKLTMFMNLIKPVLRRTGTALTAYLVGAGVATQQAEIIALGAVASGTLVIELALSYRDRVVNRREGFRGNL